MALVRLRAAPALLSGVLGLLFLVLGAPPPSAQVRRGAWLEDSPALCRVVHPTRGTDAADHSLAAWQPGGLTFRQDPPVLTADYSGRVGIRDLRLVGDLPTVTFQRNDGVEETWRRTGTEEINGEVISHFNRSWPADTLLSRLYYGYDSPDTAVGQLETPKESYVLHVRIAPRNLPSSPVRRLTSRVQYSSHVVNLRMDDVKYGTETAITPFNFESATKLFYKHFPDVFDELAFTFQRDELNVFQGMHWPIQNQVHGIGQAVFDDSSQFGSQGRLQSVTIFRRGALADNYTSTHETMHQWADYFDLAELAGFTRRGHYPFSHMALLFPHESFGGAVLNWPWERLTRAGGDVYEIAHATTPSQHPLHFYAMGLKPASAVPDLVVFEDQWWPHSSAQSIGGSRTLTIEDIIAEYGARIGPTQTEWRRATVVLSVGGLATQQEMDYWNFFAKRMGEKRHTTDFWGIPSFFEWNEGLMRLRTDIEPRHDPALLWTERTTLRNYARGDWRGVLFDKPVPSRFRPNQSYRLQGQVTDGAYDTVEVCLQQGPQYLSPAATCHRSAVDGRRRFSTALRFGDAGPYVLEVWVFRSSDAFRVSTHTEVSGIIVAPS